MSDKVIIIIKQGSDWIGGGLWWWSAFTPGQLQGYMDHRHDTNALGARIGLLNNRPLEAEQDPSMTKWGCRWQARHFIRQLRANGTEVEIRYGDPGSTAAQEQESIDKEFEKLQRRLKKQAERGTLRLR